MNKIWQQLSKTHKQVLLLILLTLIPRLYRINNPIADWHAFRQADTASVTREYVKNGINLLEPHYHDLSNIQSGHENLAGYRMVEFPLINGLIAGVLRLIPALPLVLTSRIFSVLASLGTVYFLYNFTKLLTKNDKLANFVGLAFALIPYNIYYSRVVLPEPFLLLFSTGSLYFFLQAIKTKQIYTNPSFWLSAMLLGLAILLKPFVVFLIPIYLVLYFQNQPIKKLFSWSWIAFGLIALLPFWWWRNWILQFPSGIPASDWLFNSNLIRLRPAWFRWLFYERLTKLILGFVGIIPVTLAFFTNKKPLKTVLWAWGIGLLTYLIVIATGNVQHDYYQVIFIPFISLLVGSGFYWLWEKATKKTILFKTMVILLAITSWLLAWQQVKGYFNVNHWEYVEAGAAANKLLPPETKIIAPAFGDTIFLFQTNRTGWPIGFDIDNKITMGAEYYLTTSYDDEARALEAKYLTITKTDKYLLLDLRNQKP
ncbi:MAG: hypothetical protein COU63_00965 [Candidatus Pacebacteria bacterium CG10_big_fil_rev_8_21_14_0_10_36_11]|nr:phospholipid carrier-dependent glycosyltransferase [Candidatus Pacearchaeota archaeon]OIP74590.1 MAG: hypothetical protein AUK08_00565 [Candidatus Pacebacteria bacterium CG2_30_36_39]PIR65217.1 MAG: hypothetical protein COU63_00965 [Candidatus Pacebacteria bacterium CG10_big_fil_rev_8_21_14_0_10_36_11]PJC42565.1 MAG: hypothetical protein CO040_03840 [Candidatus Pacebacteria bacterium CG_4_9_14_0_2_um_filter_36_8]